MGVKKKKSLVCFETQEVLRIKCYYNKEKYTQCLFQETVVVSFKGNKERVRLCIFDCLVVKLSPVLQTGCSVSGERVKVRHRGSFLKLHLTLRL